MTLLERIYSQLRGLGDVRVHDITKRKVPASIFDPDLLKFLVLLPKEFVGSNPTLVRIEPRLVEELSGMDPARREAVLEALARLEQMDVED